MSLRVCDTFGSYRYKMARAGLGFALLLVTDVISNANTKVLPESDDYSSYRTYYASKKFVHDPQHHNERVPILNIRYEFEFPQVQALEPFSEEDRPLGLKPHEFANEGLGEYYYEDPPMVITDPHLDPVAPTYDYIDYPGQGLEAEADWQGSNEESGGRRTKRHARTKCGGTMESIAGVITTPDYPYNYENNIACTWLVKAPENTTISFTCDDFDVQGGLSCQNDYLEISSSGDPAFLDSVRHCDKHTPNVVTPGNSLALRFVSNSYYRYRGFSCRFRALDPNGVPLASGYQLAASTNDQLLPGCNSKILSGNEWNGRCGVPNVPGFHSAGQTRLVGASAVAANEYPWMVAMLKRCGDTKYGTRQYCLICGGTVVAPQWILTAAHCINKRNLTELGVLLGDQNLFTVDTTQKFSVISEVHIHPEFNIPSTLNHDLALVKLATPIKFSRFISPICLPKPTGVTDPNIRRKRQVDDASTTPFSLSTENPGTDPSQNPGTDPSQNPGTDPSQNPGTDPSQNPGTDPIQTTTTEALSTTTRNVESDWSLVGQAVKVLGWGVVDDFGHIADKLRAVDIVVIDNNKCDYYYGIMTDSMMCTAGDGGRGPCGGDSGGPALQLHPDGSYVQVGILAFGAAAGCEVGYPSGQVLVSRYLDWIEFITNGEVFK